MPTCSSFQRSPWTSITPAPGLVEVTGLERILQPAKEIEAPEVPACAELSAPQGYNGIRHSTSTSLSHHCDVLKLSAVVDRSIRGSMPGTTVIVSALQFPMSLIARSPAASAATCRPLSAGFEVVLAVRVND